VLSIVMPAHNEEGYLGPSARSVVTGLQKRGEDFEVLVVENGSRDATREEARKLEVDHSQVRVIEMDSADYGAALRRGFLASGGDVVVNFDVDLVDLGFLDSALQVMADPAVVIVVGSKRSPGAEDRRAVGRKLVTRVFSGVLRYGFGLRASDTHGLKALRRAPLCEIVERCRFGTDIFDTELILRAERAGLEVREIPVVVAEVRPPRTAIARRIPRTMLGLCKLWVSLRREG
jgi:glycosyltransferase involved in cell wall biosynthesis